MNLTYSIRILGVLNNGDETLYSMSKIFGNSKKRASNGTILPALRRLEQLGYIENYKEGRYKKYRITEKGRVYLESIRTIREKLRNDLLENLTKEDLLGSEAINNEDLLSENFVKDVIEFVEEYGNDLNYIIVRLFILFERKGDDKLKRFFEISKEVLA